LVLAALRVLAVLMLPVQMALRGQILYSQLLPLLEAVLVAEEHTPPQTVAVVALAVAREESLMAIHAQVAQVL
jgi:hypothetical protein